MEAIFNHTVALRTVEMNELRVIYRCIECESDLYSLHTYSILLTVYREDAIESDSFVFGISDDKSTAIEILNILADNTVTATDLDAVLDSVLDMLDTKVNG